MNKNRPLVLIDLDRTLFHTDMFKTDLVAALATLSHMDVEELYETLADARQGSGLTSSVHLTHVVHTTGTGLGAVTQTLTSLGHDYLYPDGVKLLDKLDSAGADVVILTYGEAAMQTLKLALCPRLAPYTAHIVLGRKNAYIANSWPRRFGTLIDDKQGQELPNNWNEITIRRGAEKTQHHHSWWTIGDLEQAWPIIETLQEVPEDKTTQKG